MANDMIETLRHVVDDEIVLSPCVEIVVLGRSQHAPTFLRQPYEEFLHRWKSEMRFWWDGGTTTRKPRAGTLERKGARLALPEAWRGNVGLRMHAGRITECIAPCFMLSSSVRYSCGCSAHPTLHALGEGCPPRPKWIAAGYDWCFSIRLPTSYASRGGDWFYDLLRNVTPKGFHSGWVGYGILWDAGMWRVIDESTYAGSGEILGQWLLRFPGLAMGADFLLQHKGEGIRTINWMTLLGKELTTRKGALTRDMVIRPLDDGVCLQASDHPELGDIKVGDRIPSYCRVGSYLSDLRIGADGFAVPFERDILQNDFEAWTSRFDRA